MKKYLIVILLLLIAPMVFSQSKKKFPKTTFAGGTGKEMTINNPRSFMVISNQNYTFIKDSLNYLSAISHGYDDTKLECENCTLSQEENTLDYLVYTPKSGSCRIIIYGINRTTNKTVCLGAFSFNVADSVYHDVYLDNVRSGNSITSNITSIECRNRDYWNGDEEMTLISWKLNSGSKEVVGTGNELTKEAIQFVKEIPSGEIIVVTTTSKSNFQKTFVTKGLFFKD
ncbi:hypothetical protein [uncultured Fluviicola sp.]|uniref:hypothetical protein n=1 Tax=uncultured Fluviicola sp. TaxID=463303 RepID=UPI0025CC5950|nr:hypothetical protein [uncultured Fluviicola sp.]